MRGMSLTRSAAISQKMIEIACHFNGLDSATLRSAKLSLPPDEHVISFSGAQWGRWRHHHGHVYTHTHKSAQMFCSPLNCILFISFHSLLYDVFRCCCCFCCLKWFTSFDPAKMLHKHLLHSEKKRGATRNGKNETLLASIAAWSIYLVGLNGRYEWAIGVAPPLSVSQTFTCH